MLGKEVQDARRIPANVSIPVPKTALTTATHPVERVQQCVRQSAAQETPLRRLLIEAQPLHVAIGAFEPLEGSAAPRLGVPSWRGAFPRPQLCRHRMRLPTAIDL